MDNQSTKYKPHLYPAFNREQGRRNLPICLCIWKDILWKNELKLISYNFLCIHLQSRLSNPCSSCVNILSIRLHYDVFKKPIQMFTSTTFFSMRCIFPVFWTINELRNMILCPNSLSYQRTHKLL